MGISTIKLNNIRIPATMPNVANTAGASTAATNIATQCPRLTILGKIKVVFVSDVSGRLRLGTSGMSAADATTGLIVAAGAPLAVDVELGVTDYFRFFSASAGNTGHFEAEG